MPATNFFYEQNYNLFDAVVFSCNVGVRKPNPNIYKIMLKKLNVQPQEAVLIDDREENIVGAKKVGINAILFVDKNHLTKILFSLDVFMH